MKVPLVMYWPNGITAPGRTYDKLVQHLDFVPTFLELSGIACLEVATAGGLCNRLQGRGINVGTRLQQHAERRALASEKIQKWTESGVRKVIARPPNLVNVVV
mgnify:CR=1 FL=1